MRYVVKWKQKDGPLSGVVRRGSKSPHLYETREEAELEAKALTDYHPEAEYTVEESE